MKKYLLYLALFIIIYIIIINNADSNVSGNADEANKIKGSINDEHVAAIIAVFILYSFFVIIYIKNMINVPSRQFNSLAAVNRLNKVNFENINKIKGYRGVFTFSLKGIES